MRDDALQIRAAEDLCTSLRRTVELVRLSRAPAALLEEARATLERLNESLAPFGPVAGSISQSGLTGEPPPESPWNDPMQFFPYSPVIGRRNPVAPPAVFEKRGREVHGSVTVGPAYGGPPDSVHGGVVAMLLDELLGCVTVVNGLGAFTGTLGVRYRERTPLLTPLTLVGEIDRSEGRKVFTRGRVLFGERVTAEAEGIFVVSAAPRED